MYRLYDGSLCPTTSTCNRCLAHRQDNISRNFLGKKILVCLNSETKFIFENTLKIIFFLIWILKRYILIYFQMNDSCNLKTWKNYSIRRPLRAWLDWSSILTPILYQDILIFTKDNISDHDFNGARCSSLNMVIKIGHYEHGPALTLKWKECPIE
jgi:hypothetical protein